MISLFCLQKNRRKGRKAQKENRKKSILRKKHSKVKVSLYYRAFGGGFAVPVVLWLGFGCKCF